jgi:2-phosphosulfolactate phosphatase
VIDVLRATTCIATALHVGAREVVPVAEPDDAFTVRAARAAGTTLLAGERDAVRIPGFDLGNSPLEYDTQRVADRTIVLTTTNGSRALLAAAEVSGAVYAGALVNAAALAPVLRAAVRGGQDLAFVCAGSEGTYSLEDTFCAAWLARLTLARWPSARAIEIDDATRAAALVERKYRGDTDALFRDARHAATLRAAGFAADLDACGAFDSCPVTPRFIDGSISA